MEDPLVTIFRDYLRIKTVQPDPDYAGAVVFLQKACDNIGLPHRVIEPFAGRPIFLSTWEGTEPDLPSVLLNSHTDVVPVYPEHWTHDPFSAFKDEKGNIYARGAQDMKCVGIQYLGAIKKLKEAGKRCKRTIHLSFVPDEEIGGKLGMELFVETEEFKRMNIGFALDEGLASPTDVFAVFYGERFPWWVKVTCPGNPGHGSRFIEGTAAEKLRIVINRFLDYREEEKLRLQSNPGLDLGDVTTVNMTKVEGGVQLNVVPSQLSACFDIRVNPHVSLLEFEEKLRQLCAEAGPDVSLAFVQKSEKQTLTPITKDDAWWSAFSGACQKAGIVVKPEIFSGATDSRILRMLGLPALGFSPMNNTPVLLHDHDEFLNETVFLKGIDIYCDIIPALANV